MKIQLIKETRKFTGEEVWSTEIDGIYVSETIAFTREEGLAKFQEVVLKAEKFPETKKEVISTTLFMEKTESHEN